MPATAGRVRMPANNRVHSSAALQTHGIWQSAIGYDPYAPNKEDKKDSSQNLPTDEPDAENAYASFQGLLQLAKITNADVDVSRGACKRCGRVGHLKFQCKNYVKIKDETEEKNLDMPTGLFGLDKKLKGKVEKVDRRSNVESSEEEDSESSDSEVDSEIERIIAERSGKKISGKGGSSRKKRDLDDDGSDKDSGKKRKKRGRSKKRSGRREVSDSDDSGERRRRRKRRKEHRRKRDKSLDEDDEDRHRRRKSRKEKRRRRSHPSDSDSETSEDSGRRHKRKNKKAFSSSDSDSSGHNDSRIGRDFNKSEKRRRHRGDDE
ncbi:hypothetical protein RIF29_23088 [Crotalaria pallida]|uniref:CCHC-type domain-containing protein n=1 Tax=Crotalaria pallida TaxID=3830 RepID=A0AAN9FE56_CROPI